MFNVCPNCGEYRAGNAIVQEGVYANCLNCGFRHKFLRLPLFILTGASGVGKSTVCLKLAARMKDVVVMDSDILSHAESDQPETNYREYRETWLRVCKYIAQAGKPVVLCGVAEPAQFEQCVERRFFSELHYLVLTCNAQVHASRLQNRPMWSCSSRDKFIKEQVRFNRWLLENARITKPPMTLLDTSELTVDETTEKVARWIQSLMKRPRTNPGGTVAVLEWRAWNGFLLTHVLGDHGVRIEVDPFREFSSAQLDRLCDSFRTVCFQINLSVRHRLPMRIRDLTDRLVERGVHVVNGLVQDIRKSTLHSHLEVIGLSSAKATPSGSGDEVLFVKTNLNYGGELERWVPAKDLAAGGLDHLANEIGAYGYKTVKRGMIEEGIWTDPSIVVEKYVTNDENSFYRVYFSGEQVIIVKAFAQGIIKKLSGDPRDTNFVTDLEHLKAGTDNLEINASLKRDVATFVENTPVEFGAIDIVHDGRDNYYIIDLNLTPYAGTRTHDPFLTNFLRMGIMDPTRRKAEIFLDSPLAGASTVVGRRRNRLDYTAS